MMVAFGPSPPDPKEDEDMPRSGLALRLGARLAFRLTSLDGFLLLISDSDSA